MNTDVLKLSIIAEYAAEMSFATLFSCDVLEVHSGELNQKNFTLTLVNGDFIEAISDKEKSTISFKEYKQDVKENKLSVDIFIDENKIAWEVISVEKEII